MNSRTITGADIADWRPEDEAFWESTGKRIAYRNLWISIPALLCGFAVWGMWGLLHSGLVSRRCIARRVTPVG